MDAPSITVLDDDTQFSDMVAELLREEGYRVTALRGDLTSIGAMVATKPDLVVLDLVLHRGNIAMTGWDYLRLMRSDSALHRTPVLVCSADVLAIRERQSLHGDDPAIGMLEKPFSIDALTQAVRRMLRVRDVLDWDDQRELVLVADARSALLDASSAALDLLGLDRSQLRARTVADIVTQSAEWTATEWQRYLEIGHWHGDVSLKAAGGREIKATANASVIRDAGIEWHISRLSIAEG